jgi:purine catabolism regulator
MVKGCDMKLRELLQTTCLRQATLCTASTTLENLVCSLHIIDHPEMGKWVQPDQLVMSTGVNWPPSAAGQQRLIADLAAHGVSAVLLAVPHFLSHFPEPSLQAAQQAGIALLEAPWELPFHQINEEVFSLLLAQHTQLLERSDRIHRALTRVAVHAENLDQLAQTLCELLHRDVLFADRQGRILSMADIKHSDRALQRDRQLTNELLEALRQRGDLQRLEESRAPLRIPALPELGIGNRVACPIRVHHTLVGVAWILEDEIPLNELDLRAAEHAAMIAALHITHQQRLAEQEARLSYTLLDSLLEGRFEGGAAIRERLRIQGILPGGKWRLCLLAVNTKVPLTREGFLLREQCVSTLRDVLQAHQCPQLISVQSNIIYFLLPESCIPAMLYRQLNPLGCAMLVSNDFNHPEQVQTHYQQMAPLLPHLIAAKVYYCDHFLVPQILSGDLNAQRRLLQQILQPLRQQRNGNLLEQTLRMLVQQGFALSSSARALQIHIGTLRYRMTQIERHSSLDLKQAEDRFLVALVLQLESRVKTAVD